MKTTRNLEAFASNNDHAFLAGETFEVLCEGRESVWLQHLLTGSRFFVSLSFYRRAMEAA